jgi:transposase-like protein
MKHKGDRPAPVRVCPLCAGAGKPVDSKDPIHQWYRCSSCKMKFRKGGADL